jgi:hypothetical protein
MITAPIVKHLSVPKGTVVATFATPRSSILTGGITLASK